MLAWRNTALVNRTSDLLQYVWALPKNRCRLRRLQVLKYETQLSCNFQYGKCNFVTVLFWTSCLAVRQPNNVRRSTDPQICTHFRTLEQAFRLMPFFERWSYCKFLWSNPCKAIETFYRWDFLPLGHRVLDAFLSFCCIKELGDGFGCVDFARLSLSCPKTQQLSPFQHCPLASHCQQSPSLLCSRYFALWFLTTALVEKFPFLA